MKLESFIKSKARRVFRDFEDYEGISEVNPLIASHIKDLPLQKGEEPIGVYKNHPRGVEEAILISTLGLYIYHTGNWKFIGYKEIDHVQTPEFESKRVVESLYIDLKSGQVIELPVRGGRGKFRDAWEFLRFLMRIQKFIKENE